MVQELLAERYGMEYLGTPEDVDSISIIVECLQFNRPLKIFNSRLSTYLREGKFSAFFSSVEHYSERRISSRSGTFPCFHLICV